MTQAERIRQFALNHYVAPARAAGHGTITIRAGDVHREMGLVNATPAVCSAIGNTKFAQIAHVTPINRTGPTNGANVYFRFRLTAGPWPEQSAKSPRQPAFTSAGAGAALDLADALVLVSCVKSKLPHKAPARSLYTSAWFRKTRDIVEASGARWFILSSFYGLVAPDAEIAPYDYTLNTLGVEERRAWANKVLAKLLSETAGAKRVVMFAGFRYREFLVEPLERHGIKVEVPMAGLIRGEQLAWLSEH